MVCFGNMIMVCNVRRFATIALVLAGVTTLSACGSVRSLQSSSQADRNFDNRVYAGAGLLLSKLEPDTSGVAGVDVDDSDGSGVGLLLGYDINNRFSVEGQLADLGDSQLSPAGSISYQVVGLSGVVYGFNAQEDRSQRTGLSAFGRLGLGTLNNDADGVRYSRVNDVHLLVGAGLEYGFDNGLAARAELVAHETDAKYAQLGLLYRFGGNKQRSRRTVNTAPPVPVTPEINDEVDVDVDVEVDTENDVAVTAAPLPETVVIEKPPVDADLDGVVDDIDACLGTASGLPVDESGCEVFDGAIEGINFLTGSADLTEGARTVLADVVKSLQDYPDVNVTIEAHTDNRGDAELNLQLSKRRALAVARYLVDQGISGLRLKPQAFGESQPRTTNATAHGRAANRRVEFTVSK